MRWAGIFLLFGLALAAGWFLPDADPVTTEAQLARAQAELPYADEEPDTAPAGETVLSRHADGHFYANVEVDDSEIRFLIDTGASTIALTAADAEAIGLSWSDDELQRVGRGVGGEVFGKPVVLRTVQLGDLTAENVSAVIIPNGLHVSLLGQSFLSKAARVQIENGTMVIS